MNEDSKENIYLSVQKLSQIMRSYLNERDIQKQKTPMMHTIAGGAAACPFVITTMRRYGIIYAYSLNCH